jgi:predicted nucleic acid-binding protein
LVSAVIALDAGPLGLLAHTRSTPMVLASRQWLAALRAAKRRAIVPEIADFEVRRELLRINSRRAVARLDSLAVQLEYMPLTTMAMRRAAELWALARQQGLPTAADPALDADVILAAQCLTLGAPSLVVATTNIGHLSRFVSAELWQNIVP